MRNFKKDTENLKADFTTFLDGLSYAEKAMGFI